MRLRMTLSIMGFNLKYIVHLNELLNNNLSEKWECANEKMGVIFWWKFANEILRCEKQHVEIAILLVQQNWFLKRFYLALFLLLLLCCLKKQRSWLGWSAVMTWKLKIYVWKVLFNTIIILCDENAYNRHLV